VVEGGEYWIGSPKQEAGRSVYSEQRIRQKCEGVDVEVLRKVWLTSYAMVRHPISQAQWRAVLDPSWARYDATYTYGRGRRGEFNKRPVSVGFFGLMNRWGLAELHGQLAEWCADQ